MRTFGSSSSSYPSQPSAPVYTARSSLSYSAIPRTHSTPLIPRRAVSLGPPYATPLPSTPLANKLSHSASLAFAASIPLPASPTTVFGVGTDPANIPLPPSPRAPSRIPVLHRRFSTPADSSAIAGPSMIVSSLPTTAYVSLWTPPHRLPPHPPAGPSRVILPSIFRSNSQIRVVSSSSSQRRVSTGSSASSKRTSAYLPSSLESPRVPTCSEDEAELEGEVEPESPLPFSRSELEAALDSIASSSATPLPDRSVSTNATTRTSIDTATPSESSDNASSAQSALLHTDPVGEDPPPPPYEASVTPTTSPAGSPSLEYPSTPVTNDVDVDQVAQAINTPLPPSPAPSVISLSSSHDIQLRLPESTAAFSRSPTPLVTSHSIMQPEQPALPATPSSIAQTPFIHSIVVPTQAPKLLSTHISVLPYNLDSEWEEVEKIEALQSLFDKSSSPSSVKSKRWWQGATMKMKTKSVRGLEKSFIDGSWIRIRGSVDGGKKEGKRARGSLLGLLAKVV